MDENAAAADRLKRDVQNLTDAASMNHKPIPVEPDKPRTTGIAVCGSHPHLINKAPFDDPSWAIYACSSHNLSYAGKDGKTEGLRFLNGGKRPDGGVYRVDQFFEVHDKLLDPTRDYSYLRALDIEDIPIIWVRDPEALPLIPNARPYPMEEMSKQFGDFFWTSTIAHMLAKAIHDCQEQGIGRIGIWGVMQGSQQEFQYQRPGIQYFIQRALDLDIEVTAPRSSALFDIAVEKW